MVGPKPTKSIKGFDDDERQQFDILIETLAKSSTIIRRYQLVVNHCTICVPFVVNRIERRIAGIIRKVIVTRVYRGRVVADLQRIEVLQQTNLMSGSYHANRSSMEVLNVKTVCNECGIPKTHSDCTCTESEQLANSDNIRVAHMGVRAVLYENARMSERRYVN